MPGQYIFDDGSAIGETADGTVYSQDNSGPLAGVWQQDASPAPAGWTVFSVDAQEQARMSAGYPANGQPWDANAAMLGVSRLIDTAGRAYANVKGSMAATYAGQNGQTYSQGQKVTPQSGALASLGGLLPLALIGAVLYAVVK